MLEAKIPILFVGPTGTGKSVIVLSHLMSLPRDKFLSSVVNFSARTSANQTQETIMSKLDRYFTFSTFDKYMNTIKLTLQCYTGPQKFAIIMQNLKIKFEMLWSYKTFIKSFVNSCCHTTTNTTIV
jgi:ABC-type dipeptide/oligopeptide/nickel transport system ATPase component